MYDRKRDIRDALALVVGAILGTIIGILLMGVLVKTDCKSQTLNLAGEQYICIKVEK